VNWANVCRPFLTRPFIFIADYKHVARKLILQQIPYYLRNLRREYSENGNDKGNGEFVSNVCFLLTLFCSILCFQEYISVGTVLHKWKRTWADYVQNNLIDYWEKAKTGKWREVKRKLKTFTTD
jgi:hypothetical protein